MRTSLLLVDDEKESHELATMVLATWPDLRLVHAYSPAEALRAVEGEAFHLALVDLHYGGPNPEGFSLLGQIRAADPGVELIVVSSAGAFEAVQSAMRAGASDYVAKGYGRAELFHALERALARRRWRLMEKRLASGTREAVNSFALVGQSPSTERFKAELKKIAPNAVPVLLDGETGAGKEVAARALHAWGRDPAAPFVAVNCAAVPESTADSFFFGHERGAFTGADRARAGVFEEADGGTLFLDEVNSLSPDLQGRLLRVLQENEVRRLGGQKNRPVEFRLISATNQSLPALVSAKKFREDLYYRLNVLQLSVPPLRERLGDLEALCSYFLPQRTISEAMKRVFRGHSWPGNIRELRNCLLAMDALADPAEELSLAHLPEHSLRALVAAQVPTENELPLDVAAFGAAQEEREKEFLGRAYRGCGGNISQLARLLGMDRSHLHQKLTRMGIHRVNRAT